MLYCDFFFKKKSKSLMIYINGQYWKSIKIHSKCVYLAKIISVHSNNFERWSQLLIKMWVVIWIIIWLTMTCATFPVLGFDKSNTLLSDISTYWLTQTRLMAAGIFDWLGNVCWHMSFLIKCLLIFVSVVKTNLFESNFNFLCYLLKTCTN